MKLTRKCAVKLCRMAELITSMQLRRLEKVQLFQDQLSVVCIAKYEGSYIQEWIDYHLLLGVDRIYVYDNESPDHMKDVLQPYIEDGRVIYTLFPGKARQLDAYNDAIGRFKHQTRYMAFIDVDEFLVPQDEAKGLLSTIAEIMGKDPRSGGIAVNWRVYGSSGYEKRPEGFVTENYLYRSCCNAKGNDCIKTIANPRFIKEYRHVHYPTYYTGFHNINEDGQIVTEWSNPCGETTHIRINHYFTKSKQEWIERRSKGKADTLDLTDKRSFQEFYEHDRNDIYDPIMLPYVEKMKKKV